MTNAKVFLPTVVSLGVLGFGGFTLAANSNPMGTPVIPGLSQLTPVYAEVTQFGVSENKFISHQEFVSINKTREQVLDNLDQALDDLGQAIDEMFQPEPEVSYAPPVQPTYQTPAPVSDQCFSSVYQGSTGEDSKAFRCSVSNPKPGYVNVLWDDGVKTTFINHAGPNDQLVVDGKHTYTGTIDYVYHEGQKYLHFTSDKGSENWIPTTNMNY